MGERKEKQTNQTFVTPANPLQQGKTQAGVKIKARLMHGNVQYVQQRFFVSRESVALGLIMLQLGFPCEKTAAFHSSANADRKG